MNQRLIRILIGSLIFATTIIIKPSNELLQITLYLISYIIVGGPIVLKAFKNIFKGEIFDENFLMSIATIGAFLIGQYPESVAVMLFYLVGGTFESYAVDKSRKSIANLMNIRPDFANVKRKDGLVRTDPKKVKIGDIIVIKAGEKIPLDCIVIEGSSIMDTSALTGESAPLEVTTGSNILSGYININGVITAKVTKEFGESTVSKILDLVENAGSKKSKSENFITKFARYYTPAVVISAVLLAAVPPILIDGAVFSDWVYRALIFLVVSCPCALVISIPLSFFGGIGGASRNGILVKGGNYLEALAQTEIVVFDKTGTLTKGVFNVQEVYAEGISKDELLELTAYAESYSNHPISQSLKTAYGKEIDNNRISEAKEMSGFGVSAIVDSNNVIVGNSKIMEKMGIPFFEGKLIGTVIHVAINNRYAGYIVIADEIKEDSLQAIKDLKAAKIKQIVMLTGDSEEVAEKVAEDLGIDKVYAGLLPTDKVDKLEELYSAKSEKGKVAFVGDGINDAPVLARTDIGIAMGGLGSDAAIEAADVVIMTDEPSKIATAMKISKKTLKIAYQNIVFSITIKVLVLILSAIGIATMWEAVFADVGVTIIAVLNAFRVMQKYT
ncbi:MAG: heavy metal translocating P-type ATPase [Anaerovoracaceae bacterium]|jgi:Cd2+/Zn2+-exporting ATPase